MAMDRLRSQHTFLISCIVVIAIAGTTTAHLYASETQNFRIRLHQAVKQDYIAEDVAVEVRFGREVAARLLGIERLYDNPVLAHYVSLIGNSLALHSPRTDIEYHFAILDSEHVNAYSTPGGYVFVTVGALKAAQDEAEIAAVLAHEIAHIAQRHVVKELDISASEQSQLSGLIRFLGASGGTTQVALNQTVDKAISIVYKKGYKIADELEADKTATLLLAQTGYDPLALKRYLMRTEDLKRQNKQHTQTHPAPVERFAKLDSLINTENLSQLNFPTAKFRFKKYVTFNTETP